MPLLDLAKINYYSNGSRSNFYTAAVVDSTAGPETVELISNELDLTRKFPDLKYFNGYKKLIDSGITLALKRFPYNDSRKATLRLTKDPLLKFVYPEKFDELTMNPEDIKYVSLGVSLFNTEWETFDSSKLYNETHKIKGLAIGEYKTNDLIEIELNGNKYFTRLDFEGNFEIEVEGKDLIEDIYKEIKISITTNIKGVQEKRTNYFRYFLDNERKIYLSVNEIEDIKISDVGQNNVYNVTGLVTGDFRAGDLITVNINSKSYNTYVNPNGSYSVLIAIRDILESKEIEVVLRSAYRNIVTLIRQILTYDIDYLALDLTPIDRFSNSYINIQELKTQTLVYDIDFGSSQLLPEDYLIIPRANPNNWNSNVMVYFVNWNNPNMTPDDFENPVSLESVSSPQYRYIIPEDLNEKELLRNRRAKIVFDLFMGDIFGGDSGVIKELCELDEVNNKVRLVFKRPVSNIKYYQSNDKENPFKVEANQRISNKLLVRQSRDNAIISFQNRLIGNIDTELKLEHVEGFKFYLTETHGDDINKYFVSLSPYDTDNNGKNIFIEDIINEESLNIECKFHIQSEIISYVDGESNTFTPNDAALLSGNYLITYGDSGDMSTRDLSLYEESIKDLLEGDLFINLFYTDVFNDKEFLQILNPYLKRNTVLGFSNIPDYILNSMDKKRWVNYSGSVLNKTDINRNLSIMGFTQEQSLSEKLDSYLLDDKDREYLVYCFGECAIGEGEFLSSSFYQMRELITGNFIGRIQENILCSSITPEEIKVLDSRYINYLEETSEGYNIIDLVNLPNYFAPFYLATSIYIKQYLSNYLRSQIGLYDLDLYFKVKQEVALVKGYTNLIKNLSIKRFKSNYNNLLVEFNLELSGLVGRIISINISLNLN